MNYAIALLLVCSTLAVLRHNSYIFPHYKVTNPLWTPVPYELNIFKDFTDEQILQLFTHSAPRPNAHTFTTAPPFDARAKWPQCISPIKDSGTCAASWAVTTVDTFAERLCISTNKSTLLSSQDMLSCDSHNYGCKGGFLINAWNYLMNIGVVAESCIPFSSYNGTCPSCRIKCVAQDEKFIKYKCPKVITILYDKQAMQNEITAHGPLQSTMDVYRDFLYYQAGIYETDYKSFLGSQAVKIVGWGEQNSTRFWIAANDWGTRWGENGYFRIAQDQCGINIEMTGSLL